MSETTASHVWRLRAAEDEAGARLDHFLRRAIDDEGISRETLKGWIKGGMVRVNGVPLRRPSAKLTGGEEIVVEGERQSTDLTPEEGPLTIVYEDADILVLDKEAGLTVHPAPSCPEGTLVHRLIAHYPALREMDPARPGIVHRIDKDTSGLLLIALNEAARLKLQRDFADRLVDKEYLCIVHGSPAEDSGEITAPIGRHPSIKTRMAVVPRGGRNARSAWRVLYRDPARSFALCAVKIFTGRTHQIRVHMAHIGHPLWGDSTYGPKPDGKDPALRELAGRQMLHAHRLEFTHPVSGERLFFRLAPPPDFLKLMLHLSRPLQKIVITGMPGCGKSTLLKNLAGAGVPTWSADNVVASLYEPGADGWSVLRARFGDRFVPDESSPVDKRALMQAMLEDDSVRREVMECVHPMVRHSMDDFFSRHESGTPEGPGKLAAAEVPLFFESGWRKGDGKNRDREDAGRPLVVGVHCPQAVRRVRLKERRGWPADIFAAVESWQWPEEEKMRACDIVVDNTGSEADLARRSTDLLAQLESLRCRRQERLAAHLGALLTPEQNTDEYA